MARNHKSANARRNQLAKQRGFRSYAQQRRYERNPKNHAALAALPESARQVRNDVTAVLRVAREEKLTAEQAAQRLQVPMSAVVWWGDSGLEPRRGGATRVKKGDRRLQWHPLIVNGQVTLVETRGSQAAKKAQAAYRAQRAFLDGDAGAGEALAKFKGVRIGGHAVETNQAVIGEIGRRGELGDLGEMYRAWLS